jgi:hypothetical protein
MAILAIFGVFCTKNDPFWPKMAKNGQFRISANMVILGQQGCERVLR